MNYSKNQFWITSIAAALFVLTLTNPLRALDTPGPEDYSAEKIKALVNDLGNDDFDKRQGAERALSKAGAKAFQALTDAQNSADAQVKATASKLLAKLKYASLPPIKYLDVIPGNTVIGLVLNDLSSSYEDSKKTAIGKIIESPEFAPLRAKIKAKIDENPDGMKMLTTWLNRFKGQFAAAVWEMNLVAGPAGLKAGVIAEITDSDPKAVFDDFVKQANLLQPGSQTLVYKDVDIQENAQKQGALALMGKHLMLGANADSIKQLIDNIVAPGGVGVSADYQKAKASLGEKPSLLFMLDFEAYMKTIGAMMQAMGQAEQMANIQNLMNSAGQDPKWMAISTSPAGNGFEDRYVVVSKSAPKGLAAAAIVPPDAEPPLSVMSLVPSKAAAAAVGYLDGTKLQAGMTDYLNSLKKMMAAQPAGPNPLTDLFKRIDAFETKSGVKLSDLSTGIKGEVCYWMSLAPGAPAIPEFGLFLTCSDADKAKALSDTIKKMLNASTEKPVVSDVSAGARTFYQADLNALKDQLPKTPDANDVDKALSAVIPSWVADGNRVFFGSTAQVLKKQLSFIDTKTPGLLAEPEFAKAIETLSPKERKGQCIYIDSKMLMSYAMTNGLPLVQLQVTDEDVKKFLAGLPPPDKLFKDIEPTLITSVVDGETAQTIMRAPVPAIPSLILIGVGATFFGSGAAPRNAGNAPPGPGGF